MRTESWQTIIEKLEEEYQLIDSFFNDLLFYKKSVSAAVALITKQQLETAKKEGVVDQIDHNKHTFVGAQPHLKQIGCRLHFLHFLAKLFFIDKQEAR